MEELNSKSWLKSLQSKSSLAILITAAVLIELTAAIQYWYARKGIREEVEQRAKSELKVVNLEIQNIMTAVEVAVKNHAWEAEVASQIGGENHDYTQSEFFSVPMKSGKPYWSEPYLDKDGAHDIVTTYGYPLRDKTGRVVAILGADVSLDWLDGLINASHIYPSSYNMMISRKGQLMVCPEESLVMRRTIQDVTAGMKDTTVRSINQNMMNGVSGQTSVVDDKGEKNYVF